MAKSEFVRQMRLGYPEHITQWNGYNDTVQILKNRGLLFETAKPEPAVIEEKIDAMKLPYSLEALDRGIRYEFAAAGVEVHAGARITTEQYDEALKKAKANLDKDPMHYLNLVSGESSNVDKHDKLVAVKRGEGKPDVFNGLKKANLRENKEELKALLKEGRMNDLAEKLGIDVGRLQAAADKLREMEREDAAETAGKVEAMKAIIDEEPDEVMNIDRFGKEKEDKDSNYTKVKEGDGHMVDEHEYRFFQIAFEGKYDDILEDYMSSNTYKEDERELQDKHDVSSAHDVKYLDEWEHYIREFESINRSDAADTYNFQEKKGKDHDGDTDEALDSLIAEDSKTMGMRDLAPHYIAAAKAVGFSDEQTKKAFGLVKRFMDKRAKGRRVKFINYGWAGYEDLYRKLVDILNKADDGGWEVKNDGSWYGDGSGWQVVKTYPLDMDEKKGKDHDGDGDIDGDDYMAAKDKAIKKAMGKEEQLKEAIKKIIKESLLTEAATAKLSDIGDKYGDYKGMQVVINDLENIVTDMEGYFAKTRERVQSAMDKIGQVETPDGMKVGAFLAPAIETAFFKDLNPVRKLSHRDIKLPQVKIAKFDDLQREAEAELAPKRTVFGINEKKNKK